MARNMYGATSADFTLTSGGRVVPGAVLTLWTARTGGTQITDLLDVDSVACTTVTSAADGSVVYYGPDSDLSVHWADSGQGSRIAIRPVNLTGVGALIDAKGDLLVGTGNDAVGRLAVGADSTTLVADSTQPSGVKWSSVIAELTARVAALEFTAPPQGPTGPPIYGPAIAMDGLANSQVGGTSSGAPNTYLSQRFTAEQTSTLSSIRVYGIGPAYPGYGAGTGGTIRVTVEPDSGGFPSGTVLATHDWVPGSGEVNFNTLTFSSPPSLTAGKVYHIVYTNIDPDPTVNFISIDHVWNHGAVLSPRQPRWPGDDFAITRKFGTDAWHVAGQFTPILQLNYGNGSEQGNGYAEVEVSNYCRIAGANNMVRERFTVSGGNKIVTGAAVRIAKTSGTGPLTVRLEDSGGTLIDSFTVSTDSVPTLATNGLGSGVWVSGLFSQARTLTNGVTYNLRLSTDASTSLWTRGIQEGGGYAAPTVWTDGSLQVTTDGGSAWNAVSGLSTLGDLQFYFHTTETVPSPPILLSANQATGTDALGTTAGFSGGSDYTLASSTLYAHAGSRSLEVTATGTDACGVSLDPFPAVVEGRSYTFGAYVRKAAGAGATEGNWTYIVVYWLDSGGSTIGSAEGSVVNPSSTGWTAMSETFTAPAGAVTARIVYKVSNNIAAGQKYYWDSLSIT